MASDTNANSTSAIIFTGASTPKVMPLTEQLDDALAEHFWIREYIELIENGYQYAHKRIHYYDDKLRHDFWPNIGWGVQPIALETRQGFEIERARAADTLLNRRAQWTAASEEIKPVAERIYQLRRLLAAEERTAEEKMAQKDVEDEEEVYMDEDSDEVVSDGEIPEEGIEEGEEAKTMTRNAGTDDIVAVDMYLEEAVEIPVKAATD